MTESTPDSGSPPDTEPAETPERRKVNAQHLKSMRDGLLGRSGGETSAPGPDSEEPAPADDPLPDGSEPDDHQSDDHQSDDSQSDDSVEEDPMGSSSSVPDLDEVFAALRADLDQIDLDEPITIDESAPLSSGEFAEVVAERDSFLDDLQRVSAEFANYRRQTERRVEEAAERKLINLVEKLLPALDALDSAVEQGALDVEPVRVVLLNALEKEGLERLQPLGEEFDPNWHDAVMREDGDGDVIEVVEVLRAGYGWRGQVVRAAMVKVRG